MTIRSMINTSQIAGTVEIWTVRLVVDVARRRRRRRAKATWNHLTSGRTRGDILIGLLVDSS